MDFVKQLPNNANNKNDANAKANQQNEPKVEPVEASPQHPGGGDDTTDTQPIDQIAPAVLAVKVHYAAAALVVVFSILAALLMTAPAIRQHKDAHLFSEGDRIEGFWRAGRHLYSGTTTVTSWTEGWYGGQVARVNGDGTYKIRWDDKTTTFKYSASRLRIPVKGQQVGHTTRHATQDDIDDVIPGHAEEFQRWVENIQHIQEKAGALFDEDSETEWESVPDDMTGGEFWELRMQQLQEQHVQEQQILEAEKKQSQKAVDTASEEDHMQLLEESRNTLQKLEEAIQQTVKENEALDKDISAETTKAATAA